VKVVTTAARFLCKSRPKKSPFLNGLVVLLSVLLATGLCSPLRVAAAEPTEYV
jgi:hypothetical protein